MKDLISYVLFGQEPRYWANIPYILVANSVFYPGFTTRIYVHKDSMQCPTVALLKKAAALGIGVEIEEEAGEVISTELTLLRIKPLWEEDVGVLLCRDLDYAVRAREVRAVSYFTLLSDCIVHGMRSYHLHTAPYMAGLCGFKVAQVRNYVSSVAKSYDKLLEWGKRSVEGFKEGHWGCDQAVLRDFLGLAGLYPLTLDCPQFTAPLWICDFPAVLCKEDEYIGNGGALSEVGEFNESLFPGWTGQPWDCGTEDLYALCKKAQTEVAKLVLHFYGQDL